MSGVVKFHMLNRIKDAIRLASAHRIAKKSSVCDEIQPELPVLILAPHPDDEIFGCGGLIARLVQESYRVEVVICSGGGGSHRGCCDINENTLVCERRKLTLEAVDECGLGSECVHFLDFKDGFISETDDDNISRLKDIIATVKPQSILVPHHGEGWSDHLAVHRIGLGLAPRDCAVYEYCVWMWYYRQHDLDWQNAFCLRLTCDEYAQKLAAIDRYITPCAPCGNPYSGVLPHSFIRINSTSTELFFRIR